MPKSTYLANATLTEYLITNPAYLALHSESAGVGGTGAELTGSGYARAQCEFDAPVGGVTQNTNVETFGPASANDWEQATDWSLWDAAANGNMIYFGPLDNARDVLDTESGEVAAGAIVVTET